MKNLMLVACAVVFLMFGCGGVGIGSDVPEQGRAHEFLPDDWPCVGGTECLREIFNMDGQTCSVPDGECGDQSCVLVEDEPQCAVGACVHHIDTYCTIRCGDDIGDCFGNPDVCLEVEPGSGRKYCIPIEYVYG